eukprot:CAMPEP_0179432666 /NCGR_PEP_ID=MMETSP0799-20121207/17231_1 /TAXON_ID=46947 /ORGANISM="Geminigera cryophila, Strain CCMP2564" /LENGTH=563 /DNA_ID=CAMNT_0021210175 /DNA_START=215 /DNA_END=1906 /DNA_ORIENTATION=+
MAPQIDAFCYLLDANAKCAVCWKTIYMDLDDKVGVTKMEECPEGITETWTSPLPEKMHAMEKYVAGYTLVLDTKKFRHVPQGDHDIPHANIHSCIASRGACTPFVSNSPGLATHTEEVLGDFDSKGSITFESNVQLTEEQYTIIAHIRFYVKADNATQPNSKYDVAIGISRSVVPPVAEVSADSLISTAVAGGMLLLVMSAVCLAIREGKLNMDALLEAIYANNVTLCADLLLGIGDTAAYTVGVFTIVQPDNKLVQLLPAALFFMALAWAGTIYNAYYDANQLRDVYLQDNNREKFARILAQRLAQRTIVNIKRSGRRATSENNQEISRSIESHILNEAQDPVKYQAMVDLEYANRELRRKRGDVITIISESIPITIIQCFIMLQSDSTQIITILIVLFSSTVFGSKMAGLGTYKEARETRDRAELDFRSAFNVMNDAKKTLKEEISAEDNVFDLEAPIVEQKPRMGKGVVRRGSVYNYFFDRTADDYHGPNVTVTSLPVLQHVESQLISAHQPQGPLSIPQASDITAEVEQLINELVYHPANGSAALQVVVEGNGCGAPDY